MKEHIAETLNALFSARFACDPEVDDPEVDTEQVSQAEHVPQAFPG